MTEGLMGNFDGNDTNESYCLTALLLSQNETDTERKIYYGYGQKCKLKLL